MKDETLRLALEALESSEGELLKARAKIKQALEQERALQALHNENERLGLYKDAYGQPEPKPFGWYVSFGNTHEPNYFSLNKPKDPRALIRPLFTSPPKREWVGLTDEERDNIILGHTQRWEIAHMIEAKLKERNI